jgi:CubicO group peptidase (beta-lactamase class C family)
VVEPERFAPVSGKIRDMVTYWKLPSIAVAVAYNGEVIWEEGFGFADPEKKVPATAQTIYSLASVSKPITATALMTLVQKGKVKLDDPINRYLGDDRIVARIGNLDDATVRRVANHTAGILPHYKTFDADRGEQVPPFRQTIQNFGIIVIPPGERFVYSNVGFGLLGRVVETASGKELGAYLKEAVFDPLGLSTGRVNVPVNETAGVAKRYFYGSQKLPDYDSETPAAGSMFMSAHDLLRFGLFHLRGTVPGQSKEVLTRASLDEMRTPLRMNDGHLNELYGLGWEIGRKHGMEWFGHDGGMSGVTTILAIYPSADLVVVILSNGMADDDAIYALQDDIVHLVLPATVALDGGFVPMPQEIGTWRGGIQTENKMIPVQVDIHKDGSVFVQLDSGPKQGVLLSKKEGPSIHLEGVRAIFGHPGVSDAPGQVEFNVALRNKDHLSGYAAFNALRVFGDRWGSNMSYWIDMQRM